MKKKIENLSMQTQLTVVILSVIVLAFGIILYSGYSGQARSFAEEYTSSTQTILEMDVANLDQYIQGLRIFCVQPCLNVSVYNSLLKRKPLSSSEISDIKQEIQSSYHSRTDIRSYSITAMNQDLCFERNAGVGGQHILSTPVKDTEISRPYIACGSNDKYEYLAPPDSEDVFFRYYHYLIRLRNREPVSLSYVDVDTTQLRLLMKNHQDYGQILCLYNSDGELLYSSSEDIRNQEEKEKKQLFGLHSDVENVNIGGISYLALRRTSEETGIVLLSLLPKSAWDDRARDFLLPLVMQIAVITICLIIIVTLMIRMITIPLKRLSYQMGKMGEGDFSPTAFGGGCKETCALTESYNDMAAQTLGNTGTCLEKEAPKLSPDEVVARIRQDIDQNYPQPLKVSSYAKKYFFTQEYLTRLFRQHYEMTIQEYLLMVRMTRAKELLENPSIKIQEVAARVGYSDNNYFSKAFRNFFGITPTDCRNKCFVSRNTK